MLFELQLDFLDLNYIDAFHSPKILAWIFVQNDSFAVRILLWVTIIRSTEIFSNDCRLPMTVNDCKTFAFHTNLYKFKPLLQHLYQPRSQGPSSYMLQGEGHVACIQCNSICRPHMLRFAERSHKRKKKVIIITPCVVGFGRVWTTSGETVQR